MRFGLPLGLPFVWADADADADANLEALRDDDTRGGEHGPAAVDELIRPVDLHLLGVLAEAQGVVPVAAATHRQIDRSDG